MQIKFSRAELLDIMKSNHDQMIINTMHQVIAYFREMEISEPQAGTKGLMELIQMGYMKMSMYLSLAPVIENPYIPYEIIYS